MEEKKDISLLVVVRLRGEGKISKNVNDTLSGLLLRKVHNATLLPSESSAKGMLHTAENYITWGQISKETLESLLLKRGKMSNGEKIDEKAARALTEKLQKEKSMKNSGINPVFRLSPPSGGLKAIRLPFPRGDLGLRGEKINDLIMRMI